MCDIRKSDQSDSPPPALRRVPTINRQSGRVGRCCSEAQKRRHQSAVHHEYQHGLQATPLIYWRPTVVYNDAVFANGTFLNMFMSTEESKLHLAQCFDFS